MHVIKAEHVASFLGHKLNANYQGEIDNDFSTRIQGTPIRHHMGPASIKLCALSRTDRARRVQGPEVSFFKHHHVEQRTGERVFKLAPLRKSIDSLPDLRRLMHAANDRYLAFMACPDNPNAAQKALAKTAAPVKVKVKVKGRSFRGFDLFLDPDYRLFLMLARGEWSICAAISIPSPQAAPPIGSSDYAPMCLIKKVAHSYKYFFTKLGRRVLGTALVIREYFVQPHWFATRYEIFVRLFKNSEGKGLTGLEKELPRTRSPGVDSARG